MRQSPSGSGGALPRWLVVAASAAILFHLAAVVVPILDTPSGPWATPVGRSIDPPPAFAHAVSGLAALHADCLRISHNYHFVSNRPSDAPAVRMEVRLRDDAGNVTRTLTYPDPSANPWVRHRQELLVRALAPDLPVPPPQGQEMLPPPGQLPATTNVWLSSDDHIPGVPPVPTTPATGDADATTIDLHLATIPSHLVPRERDRDLMRPSGWAVVLAHSFARRLCRETGAATAEVLRITREPIPSAVLYGNEPPPEAFDELVASFGEVSR